MYSFHIEFTNGSNPFFSFPCEYKKHIAQLRRWKARYKLDVLARIGNTTYYRATEKQPATPQVDLFRF